ncbi:unnamed protein product [Euphydryas editha]|uniref:RNase H type-1 domain-containing protein n=1 Tax=Euphydryas editha TaxID=104508 RepID=A0AAU9V077_EUPED|nr:unnamed protein product [Euphydryas editha]
MDKSQSSFNINIIQWNAQSLKPKLIDFELLLNQKNIHLAILSETWLDPSDNINLSGYNIYRKDRHDSYGGVAIISHKSLKTYAVPISVTNSGIEIVHIKIINCKLINNIISVYCPSSVRTSQTDWENLFAKFPKNSLIAGDFNGHHASWSNKINSRGNQLFQASIDNEYISLNNGDFTRMKLVNGFLQKSSPDISFCTNDIIINSSWSVTNESLGSDHLIIKIYFKYQDSINITQKRNFKKADWKYYRQTIVNYFTEIPTIEDVQCMYDFLIKQINKAANMAIPFKKEFCNSPSCKFKPKLYWNQDLSKAIAERRLALSNFRKNPVPQNLSLLKIKISKAQRLIRQAKSKSWYNFCDSVDQCTTSSEVWRKMRWMKDDFVIYCNYNRFQETVDNIQRALDFLTSSLELLGLELSGHKSKLCIFTRGRRRLTADIKINNIPLESVDYIKYLGMWLDKCLKWGKHINEIYSSSQRKIQLLQVLAESSWGVHPLHMRRLYIALIRSRIDYGCYLYDNAAISHTYKLDKLQNQALRVIGGFIKSTPIHIMESELNIPPLHLRRQFLCIKFYLKLRSKTNNLHMNFFSDLSYMTQNRYWSRKRKSLLVTTHNMLNREEVSSSYPLEMFSMDAWVSSIDIRDVIRLNISYIKAPKSHYDLHNLKFNTIYELNEIYSGWHFIYTDGSKTCNGVGAAYYDPLNKSHGIYKMNNYVSVMTAELFAIYEALKYISTLNVSKIVICTDSKSALQNLFKCVYHGKNGLAISYLILSKIQAFKRCQKHVIMQWIPSHVGLSGNEEADKLAKEATQLNIQNQNLLPSASEILCKYRKIWHSLWKEHFNERSKSKGIWYKSIQCEPPHIPWFVGAKLCRGQIIAAHRLRSGHIPLNQFAFLMGKSNSPNCELCGIKEDVQHVLVECVRFVEKRTTLLSSLNLSPLDVGVFNSILDSPTSEAAKILYSFLSRN